MAATDKEVKDGFEEFDIIIPDENCLDKREYMCSEKRWNKMKIRQHF